MGTETVQAGGCRCDKCKKRISTKLTDFCNSRAREVSGFMKTNVTPKWCPITVAEQAIAPQTPKALAASVGRLVGDDMVLVNREVITDIKKAWDWYIYDTYNRCSSVPADAIDRAILAQGGTDDASK